MIPEVTTIIIYQGYPPFDELLPQILGDIASQTIDTYVMISEQPASGLIEKGVLYDKLVDSVTTEYIQFTDVDAKLPISFLEHMLHQMKEERLDILFATLAKRDDHRRTCDGIFMLRRDMWLDFRNSEYFEEFLTAKGIPTYLTMFLYWAWQNKKIGYGIDCPVDLRLQGNTARGHQRHQKTRNQQRIWAKKMRDETLFIHHWSLIDGEWQKSPPAKDNRV